MIVRLFLLFYFAISVTANLFGTRQKVIVRGKFVCPSDPQKAVGIRVKLVDEDDGRLGKVKCQQTKVSVFTENDSKAQVQMTKWLSN